MMQASPLESTPPPAAGLSAWLREFVDQRCHTDSPGIARDRERLTLWSLLAWMPITVLLGFTYLFAGAPLLGAVSVIFVGLAAWQLHAMKSGLPAERSAAILTTSIWLSFGAAAAVTGGSASPIYYAGLAIPVHAALTGGLRLAKISFALVVLELWVIAGLQSHGLTPGGALDLSHASGWGHFAAAFICGWVVALAAMSQLANHEQSSQDTAAYYGHALALEREKLLHLAGLSHEFRAPLFGILGSSEALAQLAHGPKAEEHLETLKSSAVDLSRKHEDLLNLAQGLHGEHHREGSECDPIALGHSVGLQFLKAAQRQGVSLSLASSPGLGLWHCDPWLAEKCLSILVDNAVRYAGRGQILISIEGENRSLRWSVCDEGPGVPRHRHRQLFTQVQQSQGRSGLGLCLLHALVSAAGGRCGVESFAERGGSRFWFELPATWLAHQEAAPAGLETAAEEGQIELARVLELASRTPASVGERCDDGEAANDTELEYGVGCVNDFEVTAQLRAVG